MWRADVGAQGAPRFVPMAAVAAAEGLVSSQCSSSAFKSYYNRRSRVCFLSWMRVMLLLSCEETKCVNQSLCNQHYCTKLNLAVRGLLIFLNTEASPRWSISAVFFVENLHFDGNLLLRLSMALHSRGIVTNLFMEQNGGRIFMYSSYFHVSYLSSHPS